DDTHARRYDTKIVECLLRPAEESIPFGVALVFLFYVEHESVCSTEHVNLYGVVDDKICRNQRIDFLRVAPHAFQGRSHSGQIDHRRYAREVLKDNTRR